MILLVTLGIYAIAVTFVANRFYLKYKDTNRQLEIAVKQSENSDRVLHMICQKHGESILDYSSELYGNKVKVTTTEIKD